MNSKIFSLICFIFLILLLIFPVPFYDKYGIKFLSGGIYVLSSYMGWGLNFSHLHVSLWILSNIFITLIALRIIMNWNKPDGRFYSKIGFIFLAAGGVPVIIFWFVKFIPELMFFGGIRNNLFLLILFTIPVLLILSIVFGWIAKKKGDEKFGKLVYKISILFLTLIILLLITATPPGFAI